MKTSYSAAPKLSSHEKPSRQSLLRPTPTTSTPTAAPPILPTASCVDNDSIAVSLALSGSTEAGWIETLLTSRPADVMYMHDTMNLTSLINECACLKVRTASRAVTRLYDDAFRPVGLRATQLSVLVAVAYGDSVSIAALSRMLGMDRSTLTRNLRPLEDKGLVALGAEGHHRSRTLSITSKGDQLVRKALPLWERTQEKLREKLKALRWANLHAELDHVIKSAEAL